MPSAASIAAALAPTVLAVVSGIAAAALLASAAGSPAQRFVAVGDAMVDISKVQVVGPVFCADRGKSGRCTFTIEFVAPDAEFFVGSKGAYKLNREFGSQRSKGSEVSFTVIWDENGVVDDITYDNSIPHSEAEARAIVDRLRIALPR